MLKREKYLEKVRDFYDSDLIKVFTGIRRCGKSVLLKQIIEEIKNGKVDEEHIIYLNFEDINVSNVIKDSVDLNKYIEAKVVDNKKYYLFFDEIQLVKDWEKAINSFKATKNVSIFITGSNSKLLSGELATLLTGRYVTFRVAPFSFSEVVELKKLNTKDEFEEAFNDYLIWGGMPQRFEFKGEDSLRVYLSDLFDAIVMKDIIARHKIKNITLYKRIMEYLVTNPSQTFSPSNMIKELEKENIPVSTKSVYECLDYAIEAYIFLNCEIYDIRGKRILSRKDKYYLMDLGLGQIYNTNKRPQYGAYLENIVYNELLYRGYDVSVGNNNGREIDFIAKKGNIIEYYQVAFSLANEDAEKREFSAYDNILDNYPKYVISIDKLDYSQNGIIHKNIIDWLLGEK